MYNNLLNANWWMAAIVRSIKTVAQTAISVIGTSCYFSEVQWSYVLSASLFAGLLSILTSIVGLPEVKNE